MPLEIHFTNKFEKDLKKISKQGKDLSLIQKVIDMLVENIPLPSKNKDHQLKGNLKEYRDCHIEPDWILLYKIDFQKNILILFRTGSHSDLF